MILAGDSWIDGWPQWLRLLVGCPLMVIIAVLGILLIAGVCGGRDD